MSTTEYVLLEEVSRCSVYLRSMLLYTASLQQNTISAEYARCLQHNYNIPIPANKCSIQKSIPFWIRVIFLWGNAVLFLQGQYPNKIWCIPSKVAPCPLKECSVHFQMSKLPFKRALPLLEKSIFLHNMCRIIDIEHPFQKCNMFETVSIIKEWFFFRFLQYNIVLYGMQHNLPVKKQHSWRVGLLLCDVCTLPLG